MKDCVFCKIIAGEIPCYKIYEDDYTLAFLDIANDIYGHTLVIPKKHNENLLTTDSSTLAKVMNTIKIVSKHYVDDCGFDGVDILNANGKAAEQSVFHLHFHILPRKVDDGKRVWPELGENDVELEKVCETLKIMQEKSKLPEIDEDCVVLYTDGACSGNPGAGGYASILNFKGKEKVISGGEADTTNNRMELMAVICGLEAIKKDSKVKVFSDSAYVINAFNQGWIENWKAKNWKNSGGDAVANKELWQRLLKAMEKLDVEFVKVKGHADNEINNRCDEIARNETAKILAELEEKEN